jgi:hypothetical protein
MDLAGRILIAALFVAGAVQKALAPAAAQGLLGGFGLPVWLVWPALAADGSEPLGSTPAEFRAHVEAEHAKWGRIVREARIELS